MQDDLTESASHFDFGENWADFSKLIDNNRIETAQESLLALGLDVQNKSLIDIGSGSGLFSLAALRLGANTVLAIDIDESSVETTRRVLSSFPDASRWRVEKLSVFNLSPVLHGTFDVVYSWGVLHHTGSMWRAISAAASMVAAKGMLAIALYERTPLCSLWRQEKAFYSKAPPAVQTVLQYIYLVAYRAALLASGKNPFRGGSRRRGMDVMHDIHDWLGGFPYESTSAAEVDNHLSALGFERLLVRSVPVRLFGLFGSGCSEYVYRRRA